MLFAARCAACSTLLDRPTAGAVCLACWGSVLPLVPPLCTTCGDPLATWREASATSGHCARCRRRPRVLQIVRSAGVYDGSLKSIVHALKYDGLRSLARPLARLMRETGSEVLAGADVVVPVPLHPTRRVLRGFNQAADLAAGLGMPVVHGLRRTRVTAAQSSLPAARRHGNVRTAFAPTRRAASLRDATVVIVDDVYTTGATLDACARALGASGCREVRALTAARAVMSRHR